MRDVAVALQPVQMGCIEGIVLDLQGSGVPGVKIQTSPGYNEASSLARRTSTDAKGQFSIDRVQPGRYMIVTTAVGYPESLTQPGLVRHVTVPSEVKCANATIRLGPKAAKLRVRVVNGVTQQPINNAGQLPARRKLLLHPSHERRGQRVTPAGAPTVFVMQHDAAVRREGPAAPDASMALNDRSDFITPAAQEYPGEE